MGFEIRDSILVKFTGYEDKKTDVVVPEGVKKIRFDAFRNFSKITSVVLPDGLEEIGQYAFSNCAGLQKINIPKSVKTIESNAFYSCSALSEIMIPWGVTSIENGTFYGCSSLTRVDIPESVIDIGDEAFYACSSLIEVSLPKSIKRIGDKAFCECKQLKGINLDKEDLKIGDAAFHRCALLADNSGMIIVKDQLHGYIGNAVDITVPDGITTICSGAFSLNETLQKIHLPESIDRIGRNAFLGCSSLSEFSIPDNVSIIEDGLLDNCEGLKKVKLPASLKRIGYKSFAQCNNLKDIVIEGNDIFKAESNVLFNDSEILLIGNNAVLPNDGKLRSIANHAAIGNELNIDIPDNITQIHPDAFSGVFSGFIRINGTPDGVNDLSLNKKIGIWYWEMVSDVPGNLRLNAVLGFVKAVEKKLLGAETDYEGYKKYIKGQRKKWYDIILHEDSLFNFMLSEKLFDAEMLDELIKNESITVEKKAALMNYQNENTKKKPKTMSLNGNVTSVAEIKKDWQYERNALGELCLTFYKGKEKNVIIPEYIGKDRVDAIGQLCFSPEKPRLTFEQKVTLKSIENVVIPEGIKHIYRSAFAGCVSLTSVSIPKTVLSVEKSAFADCTKLSVVEMSEYTVFGGSFVGCTALMDKNGMVIFNHVLDSVTAPKKTKIVIPKDVNEISAYAVQNCSKLTEIHIHGNVRKIGDLDVRNSNGVRVRITVYAPSGSYIEEYCKQYGYNFVTE